MIKVNLGRGGETRKKKLSQKKTSRPLSRASLKSINKSDLGGVLLLMAAIALSILPYLFLQQYKASVRQKYESTMRDLEEKKSSVQQELAKYQSYKVELESFEKQKAQLAQRLDALNRLLKTRGGPVNIIDAIGQGIPEDAWLNQLKLNLSDSGSLVFSGAARSSESVTQFAQKLSKSIHLSNVQLNEMVSALDGKEEIKNFSFEALPKFN